MTKGPIKGYQFVPTDDESVTLFSEAFNEACHSTHGAREETREIYLAGCELRELRREAGANPLKILEIGFGAGIGVIETLKYSREHNLGPVHMITTEIDPELVDYLLSSSDFAEFSTPVKTALDPAAQLFRVDTQTQNFQLTILVGDARLALSEVAAINELAPVEAIYQDAFSPKRNPALWSVEWFALLGQYWAHSQTRLSTYSASNSIRKALKHSGWGVRVAKGFGPKRQSTRARWQGQTDEELLSILERSGAHALIDQELGQRLTQLKEHCLK